MFLGGWNIQRALPLPFYAAFVLHMHPLGVARACFYHIISPTKTCEILVCWCVFLIVKGSSNLILFYFVILIDLPIITYTAFLPDFKEHFMQLGNNKNWGKKYSRHAGQRFCKEKVYIECELWTCWLCERCSLVGGGTNHIRGGKHYLHM